MYNVDNVRRKDFFQRGANGGFFQGKPRTFLRGPKWRSFILPLETMKTTFLDKNFKWKMSIFKIEGARPTLSPFQRPWMWWQPVHTLII